MIRAITNTNKKWQTYRFTRVMGRYVYTLETFLDSCMSEDWLLNGMRDRKRKKYRVHKKVPNNR